MWPTGCKSALRSTKREAFDQVDKGGVTFSAGFIGPAPYPLGPLRYADSSHLAVEDESNLSTGKCHDINRPSLKWYKMVFSGQL